ncbi:MAG: lipopolysaccharide assembly protein LapA domain-containing protein [Proteobacteria bacterium]|nr:lipopolysaccharide assembly protein LapA domain-containing protein [Pseudomonadota bacterium]
MMISIVVIIILLLVTIFSIQNAAPVAVSFIFWKFEASLAIIVFLSVLIGFIIGGIIAFSFQRSRYKLIHTNNKESGNIKKD